MYKRYKFWDIFHLININLIPRRRWIADYENNRWVGTWQFRIYPKLFLCDFNVWFRDIVEWYEKEERRKIIIFSIFLLDKLEKCYIKLNNK